jgi:SH3-like domain-containing protein
MAGSGALFEAYAGAVVWTVVTASVPVFIVLVGYHHWRRICAPAFVAHSEKVLSKAA